MRYRATLQARRARLNLNQQAVQRSHRRCDLIRIVPDDRSWPIPLFALAEDEHEVPSNEPTVATTSA